jgi:uncharacterized protein (DUF488 family)
MEIATIGFAKKSARQFFESLKSAGIRRLVDIRLRNTSHLAGFTKKDDLAYFLRGLCDIEYVHEPLLAPTDEILDAYDTPGGTWEQYEQRFMALLAERRVEERLNRALFDVPAVLLCSEPKPDHCHRRLVVEYLGRAWGDVTARHL